jgi:hypothetical protein
VASEPVIGVISPDEPFHLPAICHVLGNPTHVTGRLPNHPVRGQTTLQLDNNERAGVGVFTQEVQPADRYHELVPGTPFGSRSDRPQSIRAQLSSKNCYRYASA